MGTFKIIGADQKEYGPVTADDLRQWIAEGRANGQTLVRMEDGPWKPLSTFPEFAANLPPAPGPASAPAPFPAGPPPSFSSFPASGAGVPRTNPMAVTGLVMGIVATIGLCCCYGFPFNLLGIVFSLIGISQIKADPLNQQGRGLAIAGLVLSLLSLMLGVVMLVIGLSLGIFGEMMKEFNRH